MEALALVAKASSRHSLFKGVTLYKPTSKWRAQISHGGRTVTLGDYNTEEEAARVFDRACICKYGKDAVCNFPVEDYQDEWEELLSTNIPALLVKFKEERQRNKASRVSSVGRVAPISGAVGPDGTAQQLPAVLPRNRHASKTTLTASRQLQPHLMHASRAMALGALGAMVHFGYSGIEGDCGNGPLTSFVVKGLAQDPHQGTHLSERDGRARGSGEFSGATDIPIGRYNRADSQLFRTQSGPSLPTHGSAGGPSQRDPRHLFGGQHRLAASLDDRRLDPSELGGACSPNMATPTGTSSPAAARRRAAAAARQASGGGAEGAAAAGGSPMVVLSRTSSSPNMESKAAALWRRRSLPNTASMAPDWAIPEAAATAAVAPPPDEVMQAWDGAAVAALREQRAFLPSSRGAGSSRYRTSWNRTSGDHEPEEMWEGHASFNSGAALTAEPASGAARRRIIHVIPAARRPLTMMHADEVNAANERAAGAMDDPSYKIEPNVRGEVHGSPPLASRRSLMKRPQVQEVAEAEAEAEVEAAGSFAITSPAGALGGSMLDLGYDHAYEAPRGGFRRTRPSEWPPLKRMRSLAAATSRAEAEDAKGATATQAAVEEDERGLPSSSKKVGSSPAAEEGANPAQRWHGPLPPAAWYAAAAAAAAAAGGNAAAALPRGAFWVPTWPQRLEQESYMLAAARGLPAPARQAGGVGAVPFVSSAPAAAAAAAAAALAAAEEVSMDELHAVLLSALQRREQQLLKQQFLQEQQQFRWQQQEALVRLVEVAGLRPMLATETIALLDELSASVGDDTRVAWHGNGNGSGVTAGAGAAIQSRKRAASDSVSAGDVDIAAVPVLAARSLLPAGTQQQPARTQQQKRKSSGGGAAVAAVPPPRSLPGIVVTTPDSPTSSSSGGGGGTRDVRFLADTPTAAACASAPPQAAAAASAPGTAANRSHHLSPVVSRRPYADVDNTLGVECGAASPGGTASYQSSDQADKHPLAVEGKAAMDTAPAAAAATTSSGDTAGGGSGVRPSQKWRLPAPPLGAHFERVKELERAPPPTVCVSFGRDTQYDSYTAGGGGGGIDGGAGAASDDGTSIEVPLLLRVPASMQQQILGMLQLQLKEAPLQPQQQILRAPSLGGGHGGELVRAGANKARRIELVTEE